MSWKHINKGFIISDRDYNHLGYSERKNYKPSLGEPTHKFSCDSDHSSDLLDIVTGIAAIASVFDGESSSIFDNSSSSSGFDGGGGGDFGGGGAGGDL